MNRKRLWVIFTIVALGAVSLFFLLQSEPEEQPKFTIGVINPNPGSKNLNDFFVEELQDYGRQEGWHLSFYRCDDKETFDADLKKMVSMPLDLIITITTPGTKKAQQAFKEQNTPGVFVLFDPVKSGVINSLSMPGGNFTGIQLRGSVPKALDWLLAAVPGTKNIFVPIKFDTKSANMSLGDLKKAARILGVKLTIAEVNSKEELDTALASIPAGIDAIFLLNSIFISTHAQKITQAAINKKLPTAASIGKDLEGVLITYSAKHKHTVKQASRLAYQILQGEHPKDIPAEMVDFFLNVNLQTADKIGLTIPESILAQADELLR